MAGWSALTSSKKWIPARELGIDVANVTDGLAQLDAHTFAVVVAHDANFRGDAPNAPFVSAVLRAPDASAARRAVLLEVERDAGLALGPLPDEFAAGNLTYRGLLDHSAQSGESVREFAAYRATSDGAFVHRVVERGHLRFYFRDPGAPNDLPYAILLTIPRA